MSDLSPKFRKDFSEEELSRLAAETFVERVNYHTELDSTNTRALQLAHEVAEAGATLVLAENQIAGRGRGENHWWSGPGALTFSLLIPPGSLQLATGDWPKASLVTGLAVSDALEGYTVGERARLKWPNDVYVRGRKIVGILVEGASGVGGSLVIGVGVNVNNSVADAPGAIAAKAISLYDLVGRAVSRLDLLIAILHTLESRLNELGSGGAGWLAQWRTKCLLTGRNVQVDTQNGPVAGVCRGIDMDGALLVDSSDGLRRCLSGVVVHFDSSPQ